MKVTKARTPRERVEKVDPRTRKRWLFEKVDNNLTLDAIEAGTGIDKRTIGKAFTNGLATQTTINKLNEFFTGLKSKAA